MNERSVRVKLSKNTDLVAVSNQEFKEIRVFLEKGNSLLKEIETQDLAIVGLDKIGPLRKDDFENLTVAMVGLDKIEPIKEDDYKNLKVLLFADPNDDDYTSKTLIKNKLHNPRKDVREYNLGDCRIDIFDTFPENIVSYQDGGEYLRAAFFINSRYIMETFRSGDIQAIQITDKYVYAQEEILDYDQDIDVLHQIEENMTPILPLDIEIKEVLYEKEDETSVKLSNGQTVKIVENKILLG